MIFFFELHCCSFADFYIIIIIIIIGMVFGIEEHLFFSFNECHSSLVLECQIAQQLNELGLCTSHVCFCTSGDFVNLDGLLCLDQYFAVGLHNVKHDHGFI